MTFLFRMLVALLGNKPASEPAKKEEGQCRTMSWAVRAICLDSRTMLVWWSTNDMCSTTFTRSSVCKKTQTVSNPFSPLLQGSYRYTVEKIHNISMTFPGYFLNFP